MRPTRIAVTAGDPRARVDLVVGALAPRLIDRATHSARVALTAAGMLLLGGDRVHVQVGVGPGCILDLEEVGGTVAYPSRGVRSEWIVEITVAPGGILRWHSLPFVLAAGADVERRTSVLLRTGARALIRETIVLGRHQETGGHVRSALEVCDEDGPVLFETLEVDGTVPEPGVLGEARVVDGVIAVGFRPPVARRDLVLDRPGAIARHLSGHSHESPLDATWMSWAVAAEFTAPVPTLDPAHAS